MERKITINMATDICNCNSCGARNYDSTMPVYDAHTPKVDVLFDLHIGPQCICLCSDCLDALTMHIACIRGDEREER